MSSRAGRGRPPAGWLAELALLALPVAVVAQPGLPGRPPEPRSPAVLLREAGAAAARPADARRVLLISIDGLGTELLATCRAPVLERLAREGAAAVRARTVEPPFTLPSHTSMLSGLSPAVHGVRWNDYQPGEPIDVDTLFSHCRREGLRCGLFAAKDKFVHFAEHEPGVERFVLGAKPREIFARALRYLETRDPDFAFVHVGDVDAIGHAVGWGSDVQREAVARIDRELGEFLEAARATGSGRLAVIVTADHGGTGRTHGRSRADLRIPWLLWGDGIAPRRIEERVSLLDTAPTVLALLGIEAPASWPGRSLLAPAEAPPPRRQPA